MLSGINTLIILSFALLVIVGFAAVGLMIFEWVGKGLEGLFGAEGGWEGAGGDNDDENEERIWSVSGSFMWEWAWIWESDIVFRGLALILAHLVVLALAPRLASFLIWFLTYLDV